MQKKKQKFELIYLTVISLSLLISCLISLLGAGISILSSKNIAKKKTAKNRIALITILFIGSSLLLVGLNLSCIIIKLYLNSTIKT